MERKNTASVKLSLAASLIALCVFAVALLGDVAWKQKGRFAALFEGCGARIRT